MTEGDGPARRPARSGPHAAGSWYADPRTTSASSAPSSAATGSAPAAPTTSPRPARTSRRRPAGAGARRPRRRTACCGRSSTCAATVARRWPTAAARARALSCPYHGWVYRLDGSLARAGGVGQPDGFDPPTSAAAGAGDDVRPVGAGQRRPGRRSRSTPARSRRGPDARTGSTTSSSASAPGTSATSTGRSCSRTTARTTTRRSSTRSSRPAATSTRSSAPGRP